MTNEEFFTHVKDNAKYDMDMDYVVIALNEEAGEIAGWYKKFILRGNPGARLTWDDLKGEAGDLLYYLVRLCQLQGWTLEDVMDFNKLKLDARRKAKLDQIV